MRDFLHGYRTYIAAAILAVLGVLEQTDWVVIWDDPKAGWTALGSAALMAALRAVTTTPPAWPKPKPTDPDASDDAADAPHEGAL